MKEVTSLAFKSILENKNEYEVLRLRAACARPKCTVPLQSQPKIVPQFIGKRNGVHGNWTKV